MCYFRAGLRRLCIARRVFTLVLLMAGICVGDLTAATIRFSAAPLGGTAFRYTYFVSDVVLSTNQEVAIEFAPSLYGDLSDETGLPGFTVRVVDPNNPIGTSGRLSALALISNPTLLPFSVTVEYLGSGAPGSQPFSINQFDGSQHFDSMLLDGVTTQVPEPAGMQLTALGLLVGGAFWVSYRRMKGTT